MAGKAISGKYGCVTKGSTTGVVAETTMWALTEEVEDKSYSSCATGGKKVSISGATTISGSIDGVYDPAAPIRTTLTPGDQVVLYLIVQTKSTTPSRTGIYHFIPARIMSLEQTCDIDGGDPVGWKAAFSLSPTETDPEALFDQTY